MSMKEEFEISYELHFEAHLYDDGLMPFRPF